MDTTETPDIAERKRHVAGVFGRAASSYDQIGPRFFSHFGRRLVEVAGIQAGSRVLDVATGRGAVLFPAAERVGLQGQVTGIDLAESMVQETAAELARRKMPANVSVRQMDAEALDFPDESFDYVLCGFALFFFPRLDHALSEFCRVLRRNGQVRVTTWGKDTDERWKWVDQLAEAYLPPEPEANRETDPSAPPQPEFHTPTGLAAILNQAGFDKVQIIEETADFPYASAEECWSVWWSHGMRDMLEAIEQAKGPEGLDEFKREAFKMMSEMKRAGGLSDLRHVLFGLATKPLD